MIDSTKTTVREGSETERKGNACQAKACPCSTDAQISRALVDYCAHTRGIDHLAPYLSPLFGRVQYVSTIHHSALAHPTSDESYFTSLLRAAHWTTSGSSYFSPPNCPRGHVRRIPTASGAQGRPREADTGAGP